MRTAKIKTKLPKPGILLEKNTITVNAHDEKIEAALKALITPDLLKLIKKIPHK